MVFHRDTLKCQSSFFFPFEIVTVNACVESIMYMISLGCQFCPLTGLGVFISGWSVVLSVRCVLSLFADYQGV